MRTPGWAQHPGVLGVRPVVTVVRCSSASQRPVGHGRYQLNARVLQQGEQGFGRSNGVLVRIQRLVDGRWTKVRGTRLTTVHGVARATLHGRPGTKVRAVVPPTNNYAGSSSPPLSL